MGAGRRPGGPSGGALAGQYPQNLAMGIPCAMGPVFIDEFIRAPDASRYGDTGWQLDGAGATVAQVPPTSTLEHEIGLLRMYRAASGNNTLFHGDTGILDQEPPPGSIFCVKVRHHGGTSDCTLWAGFADATFGPSDFVGVKCEAGVAGGNWTGFVADGTAGDYHTEDLGVAASISDDGYFVGGFERLLDGSYQFFTLDLSDPAAALRTNVGDPIDVSHPDEPSFLILRVDSTTTDPRGLVVDFVSFTGRTRRS